MKTKGDLTTNSKTFDQPFLEVPCSSVQYLKSRSYSKGIQENLNCKLRVIDRYNIYRHLPQK